MNAVNKLGGRRNAAGARGTPAAVPARAPGRTGGRHAAPLAERWASGLFILPIVLYLVLFQGVPLVKELALSFTDASLLSPNSASFVGLDNYRTLLEDSAIHNVFYVTAIYTIACVILSISLGLGAALLLDKGFRGRGVVRALVTIPWAAPPVAVALIFIWIYNGQYGIFTHLLQGLGIGGLDRSWLDSPDFALPAILITTIWQIFPFSSVVLLAALQGVPEELREAAIIDRADRLNRFKAVVWPVIRPTVALLALFITIWSLRRFDLIWLMTQGGPTGATNTLVIELYRNAFVNFDLGSAAALGMIGVGIALIITLAYSLLAHRETTRR
ncbi:Inner membrane ABC transporter permease protein YcjO [Castellaniella defragrans]